MPGVGDITKREGEALGVLIICQMIQKSFGILKIDSDQDDQALHRDFFQV
jgi:hypothetical protein